MSLKKGNSFFHTLVLKVTIFFSVIIKKCKSVFNTLAFKLTIWYGGIFAICSCVAFLLFYHLITTVIMEKTNQELMDKARTFSSVLKFQGYEAVKRDALQESQLAGEKKIFFRFLYENGNMFYSTNMSYWKDIKVSNTAIKKLYLENKPQYETINIPGREHTVRVLYVFVKKGVILQQGYSMETYSRMIEVFNKIFAITMSVVIVLAVLTGWFMAKQALKGVEVVTKTARQIAEGDLNKRVPVKNRGDEIDQLAITFNHMLDRIESLITGIREMSDNIAHDLRSPVTSIRGNAEVTLITSDNIDDFRNMAGGSIEECDRLLDIINTMLFISKTDAGLGNFNFQNVNISELIKDGCSLFMPTVEDQGLVLFHELPEEATAFCDKQLIQRIISNLIDNAVKYTPSPGSIKVSVEKSDEEETIKINIEDNGTGISQEELPLIFDRFYRCDPSRNRSKTGTGLGLSLVKSVARAHGGDVIVESSLNSGSLFSVIIPVTQNKNINGLRTN